MRRGKWSKRSFRRGGMRKGEVRWWVVVVMGF